MPLRVELPSLRVDSIRPGVSGSGTPRFTQPMSSPRSGSFPSSSAGERTWSPVCGVSVVLFQPLEFLILFFLDFLQGFGGSLANIIVLVLQQFREGRHGNLCIGTDSPQRFGSGPPNVVVRVLEQSDEGRYG